MKKWLLLVVLVILTACSDENVPVSSVLPAGPEQQEPTMSPTVSMYTPVGSVLGYIVKENARDKWALVPASVVAQHPKVLIVTSEAQQLEGKVVGYDAMQNIALVHFRNSAVVQALTLAETLDVGELAQGTIEDGMLMQYASYNKTVDELVALDRTALQKLVSEATATGLTREQRADMRAAFTDWEPLQQLAQDVLAAYDKQTFLYNPDDVLTYVEQFHAQLEQFLADGDIAPLRAQIAADSLVLTLTKLQQTVLGKVEFVDSEFKDVQLADHQLIVNGTWSFKEQEKTVEGKVTYKLIQQQGQLYVISIILE